VTNPAQPEISTAFKLPDERWMKAAVAGGLWAAFEIIIGSFLHNLRIPFAGSILSAFGVMLMVAFHRMWPVKGLIWRAGLICALMKSISPSAMILGPMIGIMTEALLIELSLRTIGSNKAGYLIGGIMGVSSALIHKVVSILILYGLSIFEVYLNIYHFAVKQIGIANPDPWLVIFILIFVYIAGGFAAAVLGLSVSVDADDSVGKPEKEDNPFQISPFAIEVKSYSISLLLLHLLSIPLLIVIIVKASLLTGVSIVMVWAVILYLKYPGVYKRFRKPILWVQFLIIVVIATFFWENDCSYFICYSLEGLKAGLTMTLRAIVVIMAFSAFSVELRNPVVRGFLEKKGMRNLYLGISVAFSALPFMILQIPDARILIRHPRTTITNALLNAQRWLSNFDRNELKS